MRSSTSRRADDATWTQFGPGAVGIGWEMALMGLVRHFESGGTVDAAAVAAWMASDAGRSFVSLSSKGWREASIAGGTPESEATDAAARVTAAYAAPPER